MRVVALGRDAILSEMQRIGSDPTGLKIMEKKAQLRGFKISGLNFSAAMILKQEALSANAEFATPRECILGRKESYDGVLFGRICDLSRVAKKCLAQPFGLKNLAENLLLDFASQNAYKPCIMAVVNVTPDSFYVDSRMESRAAIERIEWLLERGAEIIDIGGASSRPNSEVIEEEEELARLREVFHYIRENGLFKKAQFSIDSYNAGVVKRALESGFKIINDVSGVVDPRMYELSCEYDAKLVLMHTRGNPKQMMHLTDYKDLFASMDAFFATQLEACEHYGVREVILDIGFGFAKNLEQNFTLIKNLSHFQKYGFPILVGASRKSSLQKVIGKDASSALSASLAIHLLALENGASILRVHDYEEHKDIIKIWETYHAI